MSADARSAAAVPPAVGSSMFAIAAADAMLFAGVALATLVFVRMSIRRQRAGVATRRNASDPIARLARPRHAWDGAHGDEEAVIERRKVELHETAREVQGQLASKIAVLERLVTVSSEKIARMEQLLGELPAEATPTAAAPQLRVCDDLPAAETPWGADPSVAAVGPTP